MSQLELEAINPIRTDSWRTLHWVARLGRWEVTCGFCRLRFTSVGSFVRSSVVCPSCGTRNLLPDSPKLRRSS